jgi:hypothetical protein
MKKLVITITIDEDKSEVILKVEADNLSKHEKIGLLRMAENELLKSNSKKQSK